MEAGYVFLNVRPGSKKDVIARVRETRGVKESHIVFGIFDAVARIEGETIEHVEKIYLNKIEKIPGITNSGLHIVACPRTRK